MSRSIELLIDDIKREARFLIDNSNIDEELFMDDDILQRAFVRSLEIIGEATKKLPKEFRSNNPEIQWRDMSGIRDILIHDYFEVDYAIVWNVVKEDIPELLSKLNNLKY